jgi:hypothetical protein
MRRCTVRTSRNRRARSVVPGSERAGWDGRIIAAIGRPEAHEVLIQPITIRGRVVNFLYVDNGGDALADTTVAPLTALGDTMARAYERLILEAKRSTSNDA